MKQRLKHFLARHPRLYRQVLERLGRAKTEITTYLRLVHDGDVVFDVGANYGDFTVLFSSIVGPQGSVHAFEPVPPTFTHLNQRVSQDCWFENIHLNNYAMGDQNGVVQLCVPAQDFGQASIKSHAAGGSWLKPGRETFACPMRTLDAYLAKEPTQQLNFLKIDVEGAELLVLKGAKTTIRQFHPIIHLEYCPDWSVTFDYTATDLIQFLQDCGYRHFYSADLLPFETPRQEIEALPQSQNIVCSQERLLL